jgi:uncharacterized protein YgbK (DUF1537 family)
MILKLYLLSTVVAATGFGLTAFGQTNNIYWDFNNATTAAAPSSGVFTGLTTPILSQGNNNGTTALLTTTSASTAYTTAAGFSNSGTTNAGAAARTGALVTGASGSAYFATSLTLGPSSPSSYTLTDISLGSRQTSTGPQLLSLYESTDNFATVSTFVEAISILNNSVWTAHDFSGLSIAIPNDSSTLSFRIYGSAGTGSTSAGTANWRIDDLAMTLVTTVVPEPSTLALLGGGGAVASLFVFRRRKY